MNRLPAIALFLAPLLACADPETAPPNGEEQPPIPAPGAPAAEAVVAEPAVIPQAFPRDRYEASWKKNPFLLKVAVIAQVKESWATDYALTSIAKMSGTYRVSIKNKKTGESKRLTEGGEGDAEFKIVAVNLLPDRKSSSVEIAKGGETATLTYDPTMTAPQGRGAVPGQPGMGGQSIPGMPVIPGQPAGNVPSPRRTTSVGGQGPVPVPGGNYPRPQTGGTTPSYSGSASVNVAPPGSAAGAAAGAAARQGAVLPRTVAGSSSQYMSSPSISAPAGTIAADSAATQNLGSVVINPGDAAAPATTTPEATTTSGTTTSGTTTPVTRRRTLIPAPVVNP